MANTKTLESDRHLDDRAFKNYKAAREPNGHINDSAQRPGAPGRSTATWTLTPGALQREAV